MESHLLKPKVLPTSYGTASAFSPRKEFGDSDFSTSGTPKAVLIQASLYVEDAIEGIYIYIIYIYIYFFFTRQEETKGTKDTTTDARQEIRDVCNFEVGPPPLSFFL
jgi:hypothetical protein